MGFSADAEAEAEAAQPPTLKGREDLREVPLITIDPGRARSRRRRLRLARRPIAKNHGGWRVWVAIADVAAYVQPGSALDRGAWRRGNTTYFPDRVAPMLPDCSPPISVAAASEDRACLAVEMGVRPRGRKRSATNSFAA